ncbi:MAG TPA: carbon monoxide dehydrogenase subunit G [Acidobacteriota bacterium]|nr:carbon monoxide dehydrogenase subunit G [Acidobacteriota bacterium]
MKLKGSYTFDAPRQAVWEALLDPKVIAKIMPGCERLEKTEDDTYKGALNVKVGPVQGKFQGMVQLSNLSEPESYDMSVDGRGPSGFIKGEGHITLEDAEEEGKTTLGYSVDANVGGRIAGVGQRLLDTTARSITRQSLETLEQVIQARSRGGSEDEVKGASSTRMAAGVAKDVVKDMFSKKKKEE